MLTVALATGAAVLFPHVEQDEEGDDVNVA